MSIQDVPSLATPRHVNLDSSVSPVGCGPFRSWAFGPVPVGVHSPLDRVSRVSHRLHRKGTPLQPARHLLRA